MCDSEFVDERLKHISYKHISLQCIEGFTLPSCFFSSIFLRTFSLVLACRMKGLEPHSPRANPGGSASYSSETMVRLFNLYEPDLPHL